MSLRSVISGLVWLPMLSLFIGCRTCDSPPEGTIGVVITGRKDSADLGVEHCEDAVDPDETLKTVAIRDPEGTKVARVTVRGRDATVKQVGANLQVCRIRVVKEVRVPQAGLSYELTVDGVASSPDWPASEAEGSDRHYAGGACPSYVDTIYLHRYARGWEP
jgi:hypothetical protein